MAFKCIVLRMACHRIFWIVWISLACADNCNAWLMGTILHFPITIWLILWISSLFTFIGSLTSFLSFQIFLDLLKKFIFISIFNSFIPITFLLTFKLFIYFIDLFGQISFIFHHVLNFNWLRRRCVERNQPVLPSLAWKASLGRWILVLLLKAHSRCTTWLDAGNLIEEILDWHMLKILILSILVILCISWVLNKLYRSDFDSKRAFDVVTRVVVSVIIRLLLRTR